MAICSVYECLLVVCFEVYVQHNFSRLNRAGYMSLEDRLVTVVNVMAMEIWK